MKIYPPAFLLQRLLLVSIAILFSAAIVSAQVSISCPGDIIQNNDAGMCSAVVNYSPPVGTGSGTGITTTLISGLASGSSFNVGTTQITYQVTNNEGDSDDCSFFITVNDTEAPVFDCPDDITVTANPGTCAAVVTFPIPDVTDNCAVFTTFQFGGLASGSSFSVGEHFLDFTSYDIEGNQAFCRVILNVLDGDAPVITCPEDITVSADANCSAVVNYTAPVGVDACLPANTVLTAGLGTGATFPLGTTVETYTVTDTDGNSASCSFNINVIDDTPPSITCPGDINVLVGPELCSRIINFLLPTVTDNCPGATIVQTGGLTSGSSFPSGSNLVEFTATDAAGNTTVCSYNYIVEEFEDPEIVCPGDFNVPNDPGVCGALVNYAVPVGTDNCPNVVTQLTSGIGSGGFFPLGSTTETYTVTDGTGNTATCSFVITVTDSEDPVLTCGDVIASAEAGICEAVVNFPDPTATDNCLLDNVTQTNGPPSGSVFPVGSTEVEFTATDDVGNESVCTFNIIVEDNEAPEITCPADFTFTIPGDGCSTTIAYADPVLSDNCPGTTFSVLSGPASGTFVTAGVYTIELQAVDAAGNTANCSFVATIAETSDPVFDCPDDLFFPPDAGTCEATVVFNAPLALDSCSSVTVAQTGGPTSGDVFPAGATTVEFTATDAFGNAAVCSFDIIVQPDTAPEINCPEDLVVQTDAGVCEAVVNYDPPTTNDSCGIATVTMTAGLASGSTFPEGETTVTYEITNLAGNSATCSFTVTVVDDEAPEIVCQSEITINIPDGDCEAPVTYTVPTGSDNCGLDEIVLTEGFASGEIFPVGTTVVTYTATDLSGNTNSCSFNVNVFEAVPPTITCPDNIEVDNDLGECAAVVTYDAPIGADDCGNATTVLTSGLGSGASFPVGVTIETYTVTDVSGNQTSCSFTVVVNDTEAPVFDCSGDITLNADDDICGTIYDFVLPEATDNCSNALVINQTEGPATGTTLPLGSTNFTFTTQDDAGNTATCAYSVTVVDATSPEFTLCPNDTVFYVSDVDCTTPISFEAPEATDNCNVTLAQTAGPEDGDILNPGEYTVEFTATDDAGNAVTCAFNVSVTDTISPVITCPEGFESCSDTPEFEIPEATDNCAVTQINQIAGPASGTVFPAGESTITYVAIDASGNTDTCSFIITVLPAAPRPDAGTDQSICDGTSATLSGSDPSGSSPSWFIIAGNGTIVDPGAAQTEVTDLGMGLNTFVYSLDPENGCDPKTDTLNVLVENPPIVDAGQDVLIPAGNSTSLASSASPEGGTFLWTPTNSLSCTDCQNPTASPVETTLYYVIYTTELGCQSTDSVLVTVFRELPNTITPDGDGVNDVWNIPGIENQPQVLVTIYNRWGNTVFESTGYNEPWDGTHEGNDLPTGSYYYIIGYNTQGVENLSGTVNIIR